MRKVIFAALLFFAACLAPAPALAQAPGPVAVDPDQMHATVTMLAFKAVEFFKYLRIEVEKPLNGYFFLVASVLFALCACAYLLRLMDENEGLDYVTVGRFVIRFAVCFFILINVLPVIDKMQHVGNAFAYGQPNAKDKWKDTWLSKLVNDQQEEFGAAYEEFMAGHFTVKVNGKPTDLTDPGSGAVTILGVTKDKGLDPEGVIAAADSSTWDPTTMFKVLNLARLVMEVGNLFSIFLANFVLIFLRLLAGFAIAVGLDKGLAKRMTYHWAWGTVAMTFVMPAVCQVLRVFAYTAGLMALQVGWKTPLYYWDYATMNMIKNFPGDPTLVIAVGAGVMLLAGLLMFGSVVIAYQITLGRVYESTSGMVGGWLAGVAATGANLYSSALAATINRQAELTQVGGQATAEQRTLRGQREAGNLNVEGAAVAARAGSSASAYQASAVAFNAAKAARERAGQTERHAHREADAAHSRTVTESSGRTAGTDVEAQNAANQQRAGSIPLGGTFVDAIKGVDKWLGDYGLMGEGRIFNQPARGAGFDGRVTSEYGRRRDYGGHTGIDLGWRRGEQVGAAADGRVTFAGQLGGYGNRVEVAHPDGRRTTYSHLESIAVREGDAVGFGESVGQVGNSGRTTGATGVHLHYEVLGADGRKIDPRESDLRPVRFSGVDPNASMATQTGQAVREKVFLEEDARLYASGLYSERTKTSSTILREDETRTGITQALRDSRAAWAAHAERGRGIDFQEAQGRKANEALYHYGLEAMTSRRDAGMEAARLKAIAAMISAAGSSATQLTNRLGEQFRY